MCRVIGVSRSGYYDWKKRPVSLRKQEDKKLLENIRTVYVESKGNYGTIKTWHALRIKGVYCGKHRIARLRREYKIECKRHKRYKITTQSRNLGWVAPNVLNQQFKSDQPNQVWVGDVTAVLTGTGWLYLSILMDLYSRKIIGWSMSERNNKALVLKALDMAITQRNVGNGLIHHSDQGVVYGADDYQAELKSLGIRTSMSRKGNCYDNAVAESFFSTLKNELVYGQRFKSREHARSEIFQFIEIYYNKKRIHQSLGYLTPEMMEQKHLFN